MLDTKRQRGILLVIIAVILLFGSLVVDLIASARADARASRVEVRVRTALEHPPAPGPDPALEFLREHDLRFFTRRDGGILVSADGGSIVSPRCVVGRRDESGLVTVRTIRRECHEVRVTADLFATGVSADGANLTASL